MIRSSRSLTLLSLAFAPLALSAAEPRTDWIDPDTGHRIVRLSTEGGSRTLYFHDNSYSPEGDKLLISTPSGIALIDVAKIGQGAKPEVVVEGARGGYMARKKREVYFTRGGFAGGGRGGRGRGGEPGAANAQGGPNAPTANAANPAEATAAATPPSSEGAAGAPGPGRGGRGGNAEVFAYNFDTKETRKIPNARSLLLNIDETFTFSKATAEDPTGKTPKPAYREPRPQLERMFPGKKMEELTPAQQYAVTKEDGLARRALNPASEAIIFTNLKTGEAKTVGYQYGNINHMQFSPTDPNLMLFCHEGTWHEVDRIWTVRTDGSEKQLRHKRTMDMEIAGHEWWSHDGKTIWFDLQTPRSQVFWVAGVDIATGKLTKYHVDRDAWSVHYNANRDNTLFMGDGGDETQVAFSDNGRWINLFRPQKDGSFPREKLVNMAKHNYVTGRGGIEPNGSITPDNKWVIFSGNFDGATHVYAVEIAKAKSQAD